MFIALVLLLILVTRSIFARDTNINESSLGEHKVALPFHSYAF